MIAGPPLEDARHLAQRYSRMRQEAEAQVIKSLGICALVHAILVICYALNLTCLSPILNVSIIAHNSY